MVIGSIKTPPRFEFGFRMLTILLSLFLGISSGHGQVTPDSLPQGDSTFQVVTIDKIFIIGNKKTKEKIIKRELSINEGDSYYESDLKKILQVERNKINNLRLFNAVKVEILYLSPNLIDIVIRVSERWYVFPVPIFDLVDRNFNDWWQNQNRDLSRTNFGINLYQNNFRGRNELLRLTFQLGYTRQFGIFYRIPYIDRSQRHGLTLIFDYSENKNIPYQTIDHQRIFFDSEDLLKVRRQYGIGYTFRNSFYTKHLASIEFHNNDVNDTIIALNNNYFNDGTTHQKYFELSYGFDYDKRDYVSYPLKGKRLEIDASKLGLGFYDDMDMISLKVKYSHYFPLSHSFYLSNYTSLYFSAPQDQPYPNLYGLGYDDDFVRGYELYLIEAKRFYLNRATLKKRVFQSKVHLGFMPLEQFQTIPIAFYLKTYFDMGYTQNIERYAEQQRNTGLSERYIFGTGIGLDFVTFYDTVLRFEYSLNRENETGFFFHFSKEF